MAKFRFYESWGLFCLSVENFATRGFSGTEKAFQAWICSLVDRDRVGEQVCRVGRRRRRLRRLSQQEHDSVAVGRRIGRVRRAAVIRRRIR